MAESLPNPEIGNDQNLKSQETVDTPDERKEIIAKLSNRFQQGIENGSIKDPSKMVTILGDDFIESGRQAMIKAEQDLKEMLERLQADDGKK